MFHILVEEQRHAVADIRFGSLLEMSTKILWWDLCKWMAEQFDTATRSIRLFGCELQLGPTDFSNIMGIIGGGTLIRHLRNASDTIELMAKIAAFRKKGITRQMLLDMLVEDMGGGKLFKQAFTLRAVSTLLCPHSDCVVSPTWLPIVDDVELLRHKDWATACFNTLVNGIKNWKEHDAGHVVGCLLFFQVKITNY